MTSTSTVGLPRLSKISRPMMSTMAVMRGPTEFHGGAFQKRVSRVALLRGLLQDGAGRCHVWGSKIAGLGRSVSPGKCRCCGADLRDKVTGEEKRANTVAPCQGRP